MGIPLAVAIVIAGLTQHLVGNEVLTGAVALDNGGHHVLGNIGIVGQQLFGILGQAVAAIAEAGVIIVSTNTGVEADTRDDSLGVETLDLSIGVEFVEVADTQGEVGVGKEFHGLCLSHTHQENRDGASPPALPRKGGSLRVLAGTDGAFEKEGGEGFGLGFCLGVANGSDGGILLVPLLVALCREYLGIAYDDAAGIEVVVEGLALTEELRREEEVELLALEGGVRQELQGVLDIE